MTLFGAIGVALFIGLSAWLGAFEGRSDVIMPDRGPAIEANSAALSGGAGPYKLVIDDGEGRPKETAYPSGAACQAALRVEQAALDRRDAAAAGGNAQMVWVITACLPISAR